jgi:vitamin K-dependent gamma-carboxylase
VNRNLTQRKILIIIFIGIFLTHQTLTPMRHLTYPGNGKKNLLLRDASHLTFIAVNWSEEGHRFSWRMKLRDKEATTNFFVENPETGDLLQVNQNMFLTRKQQTKVSCRPDLIHLFAHEIAKDYKEQIGVW